MDESTLKKRRRNLPHWTLDGCVYFVTFRLAKGELSLTERKLVIEHLQAGNGKFYQLAAAVVMPDHVHLLFCPNSGFDLSRIMKGIKGASARLINQARQTSGTVWQDESWDRIVRDADEFEEKLQYMADNPVKQGLVASIDEYDCWIYYADWQAQTGMSVPPEN